MISQYIGKNKLIKQLVNKLKLAQQENEPSLNTKSCLIMSSSSVRVRKKMNKFEFLILDSTCLVYSPSSEFIKKNK